MSNWKNAPYDLVDERINSINAKLEEMGSVFRTEDGETIVGYFGNLLFLRRRFGSTDELELYVDRVFRSAKAIRK